MYVAETLLRSKASAYQEPNVSLLWDQMAWVAELELVWARSQWRCLHCRVVCTVDQLFHCFFLAIL